MKIYNETSLENFEAWSGGDDTLRTLTHEQCEKQLEKLRALMTPVFEKE